MVNEKEKVKYSEELAEKICFMIANTSKSLREICEAEGMPNRTTIYDWLIKYKDFADKYAHAKLLQADLIAEEILEIADDSKNDTEYTEFGEKENKEWVNRSRLRVDTRKWLASKLFPKRYGDRLEVDNKNYDDKKKTTFDLFPKIDAED